MHPFIDTHAHLYDPAYAEDLDLVIQQSVEKGLVRAYLPNLNLQTIAPMIAVEKKYPNVCKSMLGLHPCDVKADFREQLQEMEAWFGKHQFVGIGEVGLDLYWDDTYYGEQIEALDIAIQWAKKYGLPLILHARNSLDKTIAILRKAQDRSLKGIFHAFTGTLLQAQKIADLGFFIGIGGIVTFRNSTLPQVVEGIDLRYLVLETDSPYLTPTPYRGKRNHPAYLSIIAEAIATIKKVPVEAVAKMTTKHAQALFEGA